jgi:hypothetical protein
MLENPKNNGVKFTWAGAASGLKTAGICRFLRYYPFSRRPDTKNPAQFFIGGMLQEAEWWERRGSNPGPTD